MTSIEVMIFDLDDTLFAHRAAVDAGIVRHLRAVAPEAEFGDAAAVWFELEETEYHRYLSGELDYQGQRRSRVRRMLEPVGITLTDAEADAWFDVYLREYEAGWALHTDADACLLALADAGLRVGLITNGDLAFQQAKLRRVGLDARLEHVVASGDFGVTKPDPRIFQHACNLFDVPPSAAAYVGDRFRTDALGAAGAGMLGIWLDRTGAATPAERAEAADAGVPIIRTLDELPSLLG